MSLSPQLRQARARLAANRRHHPDLTELHEDDQRALKAGAAERYLRQLLNSSPPLTAEERGRLAALLAGDAA